MSSARALRLGAGFMLFQAAWFACVVGAARGQVALGIAAVVAVIAVLLTWSTHRAADLGLIALALVTGAVWDSALIRFDILHYASPGPLPGWAPPWILALWALFAPMLRDPLRWLHGRPVLAALVGAVSGALSYVAAERLGACNFSDPAVALAVLGAGWALITPLLLAAAQRLDHGMAWRRPTTPRGVNA
jgi:hypothetical protein